MMAQPHSPFQSALPATRRAQTYLTPEMAALLNQQGGGQSEISGIDRNIRQNQAQLQGPLPSIINPGAKMQVAPHWTQALSNAANNLTTNVQTGRLRKTRDAKAQQLEKYNRDLTRIQAETAAKQRGEDTDFRDRKLGATISATKAQAAATAQQREEMLAEQRRDNARIDRHHRERQDRLATNEQTRINEKIDVGVRKLGTDLSEYTDIGLAITDFADLYAPYAEKGTDIPGTGYIEGAPGIVGSAARIGKDLVRGDKAGQQLNAARRGFINPIMREDAGTAQTYTETRNVLMELGASGWEDEDVFREAWPRVVAAYNRDMERLRATYAPEVVQRYEDQYQGKQSPLTLLDPLGQKPTPDAQGHSAGDVPGQGGFQTRSGNSYTVE